jgi:WD40 repeat protein
MAWSPNYEGLLATGGGEQDNIIRIWDFKKSIDDQHSIKCNSEVTSVEKEETKVQIRCCDRGFKQELL